MKQDRIFFIGFIGGALLTLTLSILIRTAGAAHQGEILAQIGNETLTRENLGNNVTIDLVPIENDEYRVLERGVQEWANTKLLEREAKSQGVSL